MSISKKSGFTLVELLVVVAIIAVIGAGVAVTYQRLDDKAKTSVEISDVSILKKVIKHWSAINDYKLVNEMDSLIDSQGNLYTAGDFEGMGGSVANKYGKGLNGPFGATLMVEQAPDEIVETLATSGMTLTYKHIADATDANDSTWEANMMGGGVDVKNTRCTLVGKDALVDANALVDAGKKTADDFVNGAITINKKEYKTLDAWQKAYSDAEKITDSNPVDKLAFIYPGGGASMAMGPNTITMPMNLTDEIISNCGFDPEDIVKPGEEASKPTAKYYLIAMGLGRFSSIYSGKSIRADAPAYGKRQVQNAGAYNRYVAVIRIPVGGYNSMTGAGEPAQVIDVLTPQGYSVAALRDNLVKDEDKIRD